MTTLQVVALISYLLTLLYIAGKTNISATFADPHRKVACVNATAFVMLFWFFRLHTTLGPDIHFLLATALTLILGFRMATLSATLCLLAMCFAGKAEWSMLGVLGLTKVIMPVGITYTIYALSFHKIPRHFLVYIFLCAFLPAAAVLGISMLTLAGYYVIDGIYSGYAIIDNYVMIIPLMIFPEALLNGAAMTLLVIYKPEWVYTFDDKFYFDAE